MYMDIDNCVFVMAGSKSKGVFDSRRYRMLLP
jgi:hypothetical protein